MIAIALLCRERPPDHVIAFYLSFVSLGYHVYILPDIGDTNAEIGGIQILSIPDSESAAAGYFEFCPTFRKPSRVIAWDKALYFFNRHATHYDHVWLIEDDVFIPSAQIIVQLDSRHPLADLVSRDHIINTTGELDSWYWWKFVPKNLFPLPWSHSLVCAVRLSRRLLSSLDHLIIQSGVWLHTSTAPSHDQAFRAPFIEFIFHLIALNSAMEIATPPQLSRITWRRKWQPDEISAHHFTHPIKDLAKHAELRQRLS